MADYSYASMDPQKYEIVECSGNVRWSKDGKLQQLFTITEYTGGSASGQRQEWLDVPHASK